MTSVMKMASIGGYRYLRPSEILYTQCSIGGSFRDGRSLDDTLDALTNGSISIESIPVMEIVRRDNKWWSLDNRRLWVFKRLEDRARCTEIKVKIIHLDDRKWKAKFTTLNDGQSIEVRAAARGVDWDWSDLSNNSDYFEDSDDDYWFSGNF